MARYQYTGIDTRGNAVEGRAEAESAHALAGTLRSEGVFSYDIRPEITPSPPIRREGRLGAADLNLFTEQLGNLSRSGMPLVPALEALSREVRGRRMRRLLEAMQHGLAGGRSLEDEFARHGDAFPPLYTSLIRVGERTGNLPAVLQQLSAYGQRHIQFRNQMAVAAAYPAFLLLALLIFMGLFVPQVLGQFAALYDQMGAELPRFTTAVLGVGRGVMAFGLPAIGILAVLALPLRSLLARRRSGGRVRYVLDGLLLRLPVIGPLVHTIASARFLHAFAMLLKNGAPVVESLHLAGSASGNGRFEFLSLRAAASVEGGEAIGDAVREAGLLRNTHAWMLRQGERSGDFPGALARLAVMCDREVETRQQAALATLGPCLIALCGLLVGAAVVACFLPVFQFANTVQV